MMSFLLYDLKVAVLLGVFYMFYRLLMARETFHRLNRLRCRPYCRCVSSRFTARWRWRDR